MKTAVTWDRMAIAGGLFVLVAVVLAGCAPAPYGWGVSMGPSLPPL